MTIDKLYYICDNLGPSSAFKVFKDGKLIFECRYWGIPANWCGVTMKGFKIVDDVDVEVYL